MEVGGLPSPPARPPCTLPGDTRMTRQSPRRGPARSRWGTVPLGRHGPNEQTSAPWAATSWTPAPPSHIRHHTVPVTNRRLPAAFFSVEREVTGRTPAWWERGPGGAPPAEGGPSLAPQSSLGAKSAEGVWTACGSGWPRGPSPPQRARCATVLLVRGDGAYAARMGAGSALPPSPSAEWEKAASARAGRGKAFANPPCC